MTARRLAMALATVLGIAKRGFFIPYRYAADIPESDERRPYGAIDALFAGRTEAFAAALGWVEAFADDLRRIGEAPAPAPRWRQDWFPRLDGALAYALVRHHRPRVVVEVGSGHSTRFVARAVADGGLATAITAIDPAPRAILTGLPVKLVREPLQRAGTEPFAALGPGDALLVDSSHVLMPGSDVDFLLNRVLPALPGGVFVHFHDIFLPWGYPPDWAWRGYNEQQAVCQLVLGGTYEVIFASHYVGRTMADHLGRTVIGELALLPGAHESGLWLRKRD